MPSDEKSSILDVISGNESVKVDIGVSLSSLLYLFSTIMVCGLLLILINKKIR